MTNRSSTLSIVFSAVLFFSLFQFSFAEENKQQNRSEEAVQVILEFDSSVDNVRAKSAKLAQKVDGQLEYVYSEILNGSALSIAEDQLGKLQNSRNIKRVNRNEDDIVDQKSFVLKQKTGSVQAAKSDARNVKENVTPFIEIGDTQPRADLVSTLARIDFMTSRVSGNSGTQYTSVVDFRVPTGSRTASLLQESLKKSSSAGVTFISTIGNSKAPVRKGFSTENFTTNSFYSDYTSLVLEWGYDAGMFLGGFGLGVGKYAVKSLHDIIKMGKELTNPGEFLAKVRRGINEMISLVNKEGGVAFLKVLLPPSVFHQMKNWSTLSSFERGVVTGHFVGLFGVEIAFAFVGIEKVLAQISVKAGEIAARLHLLLKALRRIQKMETPPQLRQKNAEQFLRKLFEPREFQANMINTVLKRFSYNRRDAFKAIYAKTLDKIDQKGIGEGEKFGKNFPLSVNVIGHEVYVSGKIVEHDQVLITEVWHKSATGKGTFRPIERSESNTFSSSTALSPAAALPLK